MNLQMIGIDFQTANIEQREPVSFTENQVITILSRLKEYDEIKSCVLLATCNRTEIYMHTQSENASEFFAEAANFSLKEYKSLMIIRKGKQAAKHLMEVAAGMQSQIFGDDQIISQVRNAVQLARNVHTMDELMETLFRRAVTAGKRIKTETKLSSVPISAASRSVQLAKKLFDLHGKKVVIIGNGEMGRLAASLFVNEGCNVTVTLRTYRHGQTIVPAGCSTYPYENRYSCIDGTDIVCSATTSPHYTLMYDSVKDMKNLPKLWIDLAMPRDIDCEINKLGVTLWNLDNLGNFPIENEEDLFLAGNIIDDELEKLFLWNSYRAALPIMMQIKEDIIKRLDFDSDYQDLIKSRDAEATAEYAVNRAVDLIFSGIKENIDEKLVSDCLKHIRKGLK